MSRLVKPLSLSVKEKAELEAMLDKGVPSVGSLKRGQVLQVLHQGKKAEQVGKQMGVSLALQYCQGLRAGRYCLCFNRKASCGSALQV